MTKRHNEVFDAVLSGVPNSREKTEAGGRGGARFLKRNNALSDRLSGEHEEKTLHWVDPARCRMWERHNRDYSLLTEENCRDLIEGIRAQGRQEFPAIVRRIDNPDYDYEVICGARRHFAVSWLQANNYPQFKYLVEAREVSDEEAFRLADIENRDREDISDYERASDYAEAIGLYYGGKQKAMAERLEVSEVWLSRYLEMARLPSEVVAAFSSIRDIRELHARTLKPLLKVPKTRQAILVVAKDLARKQQQARNGQGAFVDAAGVMTALRRASGPTKAAPVKPREYSGASAKQGIKVAQSGKTQRIEFAASITRSDLQAAFDKFMREKFKDG